MKLRVGLVGLGNLWEVRYRPALRALSDRFEVRAVCEQVAHRAEQAAREFNATVVDGFRALTQREDIDAVLMLGRQWFGSLPILAACDSGKAVYCATGFDLEPVQAREIRARVEESGIAFMSEFPCRQAPATLRLKELIATQLGKPQLIFCHRREPNEEQRPGSPKRDERSPSNTLIELVDWCCYVVGSRPTSVFGMMHRPGATEQEPDYQMLSLDFSPWGATATEATAQISNGRYVPASWPEAVTFRPPAALQVACEHGIAFIDLPSSLIWFDKAGRHLEQLDSERPIGEQSLAQFYRGVTSLVRSMASLEDAYLALDIVHLARTSHERGARIPIEPH
jgi:predicted dehydrogenase